MIYCGIDPGSKGYVCLLDPTNNTAGFMPCASSSNALFAYFTTANPRKIMVEDVHSLFGMSAKSNFNFGYNVGFIQALAMMPPCGMDLVQPKVWQKAIGVKPGSKTIKQDVAKICQRLYPQVDIYGPRGGLIDGKADSLMIAHFCFLRYGQTNGNQVQP